MTRSLRALLFMSHVRAVNERCDATDRKTSKSQGDGEREEEETEEDVIEIF